MAIAVLPYPSMDFTPLDVLTADELDQLVANINAVNNGTVPTASIADGAITTPKLASNAVATGNIDWTTILGTIHDTTTNDGYMDFGTVRIQWMTRQKTGLNTSANSYNTWTEALPASFGSANFTAVACPETDVGNVAGDVLKITGRTASSITLDYEHTGVIGGSSMYFGVIAVGKKP